MPVGGFNPITGSPSQDKSSEMPVFWRSVALLGHIISSIGVSTDPDKVAAIVNWPPLPNLSEL